MLQRKSDFPTLRRAQYYIITHLTNNNKYESIFKTTDYTIFTHNSFINKKVVNWHFVRSNHIVTLWFVNLKKEFK